MKARRDGSRIDYERIAREITQPISVSGRLPGTQAEKQFGGPHHRYRTKSRRATTSNQPINKQKQHRANYRSDKTGWLPRLVPADDAAEKSGQESARDAEQNRDQTTARIAAWHQQLCDGADDQADNECA